MGGEMIFTHNTDKLIEDLDSYKKILKEMENDCATSSSSSQTGAVRRQKKGAVADKNNLQIRLIKNPISNWNNGYIKEDKHGRVGQDDDYELSVDLGTSTRNTKNIYYVLFPKNPNALAILSNTHARGMLYGHSYNSENKKWIHDYFVKFVTTFPGVFELYYGDDICGYGECEVYYRDGSDRPVVQYFRDSDTY